jgi:hypothetical protein
VEITGNVKNDEEGRWTAAQSIADGTNYHGTDLGWWKIFVLCHTEGRLWMLKERD